MLAVAIVAIGAGGSAGGGSGGPERLDGAAGRMAPPDRGSPGEGRPSWLAPVARFARPSHEKHDGPCRAASNSYGATRPAYRPADDARSLPRIYLWIIRGALEDTVSFAAIVDSARVLGCTDLLVQVRGRGEAYYRSATEPAPRFLEAACPPGVRRGERPSEEALPFDPLAAACRIARARGMRIHAWFNVFLTGKWDGNALRNAVVLHPDWAARLKDGRSPGDLADGDRLRSRIEGVYLSPGNPDVVRYLRGIVRELVTRYPLDGLHLDYIRYPFADAGYDDASREAFLIADLEESVPLAADSSLGLWDRWRIAQVSRVASELAGTARSARPGIEVTAAVIPDPAVAMRACKQDWPRWLAEGWIDAAMPMTYTASPERFDAWLRAGYELQAGSGRIIPGLGLHKLDAKVLDQELGLLEAGGTGSYALFSHVELMAKRSLRDAIRRSGGVR